MFQQNDKVQYVGERHKQDLKGKIGSINSKVANQDDHYVIDFPEDSYVMHESCLARWRAAPGKNDEPEIRPRRKRPEEEE